MQISTTGIISTRSTASPTVPQTRAELTIGDTPDTSGAWQNPAAAAALRTSAELLKGIEDGITQNFQSVDRVRTFAVDLRSTGDIIAAAGEALLSDASPENDQFLPLIGRANNGVSLAEIRLTAKDLASTWPFERGDILASVRQSRVLSEQIARSLGG